MNIWQRNIKMPLIHRWGEWRWRGGDRNLRGKTGKMVSEEVAARLRPEG